MNDLQKYFYVNIREYFGRKDPDQIGEADLQEAISDFTCPRNPDVERFLKHNAIEFTKASGILPGKSFPKVQHEKISQYRWGNSRSGPAFPSAEIM